MKGYEPIMSFGEGAAEMPVLGTYRLIFVVWNTLFNLLTQDDQVRCFENVAVHLTDDGAFVVEAFVPAFLYRLRDDHYVDAEAIRVDEVRLDVLRHGAATQMIEESHVSLSSAGVRLQARWGGWNREPFDSASRIHVSIYGR